MAEKLTEQSEVLQLLRTGPKTLTINLELYDKVICAGNPKFQEYKLDKFRTCLYRIEQDTQDNSELVIGMCIYQILFEF